MKTFAAMFAIAVMMVASSAKTEEGFDFGVDSGYEYADYGSADEYEDYCGPCGN